MGQASGHLKFEHTCRAQVLALVGGQRKNTLFPATPHRRERRRHTFLFSCQRSWRTPKRGVRSPWGDLVHTLIYDEPGFRPFGCAQGRLCGLRRSPRHAPKAYARRGPRRTPAERFKVRAMARITWVRCFGKRVASKCCHFPIKPVRAAT